MNHEEHIVIGADRHITVPESLRRIAVQYDHNVETVTFDCPRYWDNHDISKMRVYINYMRKDRYRDKDLAENITVDETDQNIIHFTWTISRNATLIKGELRFLVCAVNLDSDGYEKTHWNSELCNQAYVTEGLECDDYVKELHADIITDLLLRMDKILIANTPILDKTLTEAGLAADAKVTGDKIVELRQESQLADLNLSSFIRTESDNLAKAVSTETSNRKAEIAVERARIDKFVALKPGSTTGDAELIDARIGANGVTYSSLGSAVRGQVGTLSNAISKVYRFDLGGIANGVGTVTAHRTRIRIVLPYFEPSFDIVNFKLPDNVQKATVIGLKDDKFVADIFTACTFDGTKFSFNIDTSNVDIDSIGLTFQHADGSEFTSEEVESSYIEYRASSGKIADLAHRAVSGTMLTGTLRRGVISTTGVFSTNSVALSTEFLKCYDDKFVLIGMDGYLLLRCVGLDVFGNYAALGVLPEEGGYRVDTSNIEEIAFSFYKGMENGSHIEITDEEFASATFSYTSSFEEFREQISDLAGEMRGWFSDVEERIDSVTGSKMASLGDSITYGFIPRNAPGYPGKLDSYAALTAEYYGMEFANHGISGSTVAYIEGRSPMCERVSSLPDDANIVTFMGGTNDIRNGVKLGAMSDRTNNTFYGALHIIMSALYEKYIVNKFNDGGKSTKIVICTPIKLLNASSANQNETDGTLMELGPWVEAIKEVANYYSLPVLDFYNISKINPHLNRTLKGYEDGYTGYYNPYITDGTHPTQEGAKMMAECLISFLKTV